MALPPPSDCSIIGDCGAAYYPQLFVNTTPINFTAQSGGNIQSGYTEVNNRGGGHLIWAAVISYTNGSGWLQLYPDNGIDNTTIRVDASPANLAPGTYQAILTVYAGPQPGSASIPITFVVTAQPPPPPHTHCDQHRQRAQPLPPGRRFPDQSPRCMGTQLAGKKVAVGFDGLARPGSVRQQHSDQCRGPVRAGRQVVRAIGGGCGWGFQPYAGRTLGGIQPRHFRERNIEPGRTGQWSQPSSAGGRAFLQIFATGLSGTGTITARVNGNAVEPAFAGAAPGIPGVQQVNVQLPEGLTGSTAAVSVCGGIAGMSSQATCSPAVQVAIAQ